MSVEDLIKTARRRSQTASSTDDKTAISTDDQAGE
jgi:hypothetical protein